MGAYGLQTHIWNNNLKSVLLLAGFPLLLLVLMYGLCVGYVGLAYEIGSVEEGLLFARDQLLRIWPFAFLGAGEGRPALHSPLYDFNDAILAAGAGFLARVAELALSR